MDRKLSLPESWVEVDDIWYSHHFNANILEKAFNFVYRPTDILVASWPKCGNNWTQEIIKHIIEKDLSGKSKKLHMIDDGRLPFLEYGQPVNDGKHDIDILNNMPDARLIKTHLQPKYFIDAITKLKCKVIYITRHPKDAITSFYYHYQTLDYFASKPTWNEFFSHYMEGGIEYGDYCDYELQWLSLQKNKDLNILPMKYEEMKGDHKNTIKKIAKFIDIDLTQEMVEDIEAITTVRAMKPSNFLVRKGTVGDYKNHFTVAQDECFNSYFEEKMRGSGYYKYKL